MNHKALKRSWDFLADLPQEVQELAHKNFALLEADPKHPSLHFKRIGSLWSVRVGDDYRALGRDNPPNIVWFWIGHHSVYDRLIENQ